MDYIQYMDGEWYLSIATNGYNKISCAFFPLFPLLINILTPVGVILLNNLLAILTAILLHNKEGRKATLLFLISPIQIYCFILYTESLFIFLTLCAYYLYKDKKYLFSGIILGLSVACRNTGSLLFFAIFIVFFINIIKKRENFKDLLKMYIPATIISCIYPILLQYQCGDWKYFIHVQVLEWGREKSNFIKMIINDFKWIDVKADITSPFQSILSYYYIFLSILGLGLLIYVCLKYKSNDTIIILYTIMTFLAITSTSKIINCEESNPSTSCFRYALGCFPIYLVLGKLKKYTYIVILCLSTVLMFFVSFNFLLNGWPF